MFFILSKLLVHFIYPSTWILILLLGALLIKGATVKRNCLIAATVLYLVFTNPFLLNSFARSWDVENDKPQARVSCAIVLGGFVSENEKGEGYLMEQPTGLFRHSN
jgi:hypothetical protein